MAVLATCLTVALAGGAFGEPSVVELQESVYVKGPTVTLGEIARIKGPDADFLESIELLSAATPGGTRRLNASIVQSRLEQAGVFLEDIELQGPSTVHATTMFLELTPGMIRGDLRKFIEAEMPWEPGEATIDVIPPAQPLVVSDGHVEFRWRIDPGYDYLGQGTFRGEVLVDGRTEQTFYAKAEVEAYEPVAVAARDIERGERLTRDNVKLDKRALSGLRRGAYFSLDDLQGFVARSTIFRGQILTERKVEAPILIKRNQMVTVETRLGALTVQGQAKALNSAAAGDVLLLESLSSEREMSGIVRADGTVVIE